MPVLLEVLETHKIKHLLNSRIKIYFIVFLCFFVENQLEGHETTHILVFVDEDGFNLSKGWSRSRNLFGHRATTDKPGQLGANITMCAAISENGVSTHIPHIGS